LHHDCTTDSDPGYQLKLDRADEHPESLKAEIRAFLERDPYKVRREDNRKTGEASISSPWLRGHPIGGASSSETCSITSAALSTTLSGSSPTRRPGPRWGC
jgi:hypothetical protein